MKRDRVLRPAPLAHLRQRPVQLRQRGRHSGRSFSGRQQAPRSLRQPQRHSQVPRATALTRPGQEAPRYVLAADPFSEIVAGARFHERRHPRVRLFSVAEVPQRRLALRDSLTASIPRP